MLPCHLVAGLQTAALVLGARLAATARIGSMPGGSSGEGDQEQLAARKRWRRLLRRLLAAAVVLAAAVAGAYAWQRDRLLPLFTADAAVAAQLRSFVWPALCLLVLAFSPTTVLTGVIFAGQRFAFMRNLQIAGFVLVFVPALAIAAHLGTLPALWAAKLAFYAFLLLAEAAGVAAAW